MHYATFVFTTMRFQCFGLLNVGKKSPPEMHYSAWSDWFSGRAQTIWYILTYSVFFFSHVFFIYSCSKSPNWIHARKFAVLSTVEDRPLRWSFFQDQKRKKNLWWMKPCCLMAQIACQVKCFWIDFQCILIFHSIFKLQEHILTILINSAVLDTFFKLTYKHPLPIQNMVLSVAQGKVCPKINK